MKIGSTLIEAVRGNIVTMEFDAIVNAANSSLLGGGGVDGAVHRAAGPDLVHECRLLGGRKTGQAKTTKGYRLPAEHIIHTVGPDYGRGETDRDLLVSCYRRCLEVADELGAQTVALPLVSAGVYAWPLEDAVDAAVTTLRATETRVREVRIVAFSDATHRAVLARLEHG